MSRLLDIRNLAVSYGAVHALKQVSLHVDTNEIVTIIGGNGAGKSTMMRALSGIEPSTGSITFAGQDLAESARTGASDWASPMFRKAARCFPTRPCTTT